MKTAAAVMRRLLADTSGESSTANMLTLAINWFVIFLVFLMIVQLGLVYGQRDAVDHASTVATDTAMKTFCDKNAADGVVLASVKSNLELVGAPSSCSVQVKQQGGGGGGGGAGGGTPLSVAVHCQFRCSIPIAAQVMCSGGSVTLDKEQRTVALGCDGK